MKIRGNTVGTTTPRANLAQTDPKKADFVKGKEIIDESVQNALTAAKESGEFTGPAGPAGADGPPGPAGESGVYILSDGETPADAPESASVVIDPNGEAGGAVTDEHINKLIYAALGVIENGTY